MKARREISNSKTIEEEKIETCGSKAKGKRVETRESNAVMLDSNGIIVEVRELSPNV